MEFVNTILNTQCVNEHSRNIDLYLKDPIVAKHLSHLHDKYVFVPADKVLYNMFLSLQTKPYAICFCPCRQGPMQYVIVPADKAPNNNVFPCKYTLQNTEGAIKNGQSRETGYTGHTR